MIRMYRWRRWLRAFDFIWRCIPDGWPGGRMKYRFVTEEELKASVRKAWGADDSA